MKTGISSLAVKSPQTDKWEKNS